MSFGIGVGKGSSATCAVAAVAESETDGAVELAKADTGASEAEAGLLKMVHSDDILGFLLWLR